MITDKDIDKLLERFEKVFATKIELKQETDKIREEMVTKDEFRDLFGKVESLATMVKKMNEEWTMHFGQHGRINEQLTSHEKRIVKLENSVV